MNNYPIWWEDTITLYNKHTGSDKKITWYRTVLHNCFWKYKSENMSVNRATMGWYSIQLDTKSIVCRIPKNDKFLSKAEWNNSDHTSCFTLSPGDIIIRGEVDLDIDEYTAGKRSSEITSNRDLYESITIETVSVNVGTGKGNEHYKVTGE